MDGLLSSEAPAFEPVGVEGADPYGFEPAELGRLLGQVRRPAAVLDFRHRPHPNPCAWRQVDANHVDVARSFNPPGTPHAYERSGGLSASSPGPSLLGGVTLPLPPAQLTQLLQTPQRPPRATLPGSAMAASVQKPQQLWRDEVRAAAVRAPCPPMQRRSGRCSAPAQSAASDRRRACTRVADP